MGNYRFRLSDMMPNAWFYKLKDMNKSRNQQNIIYHNHVSKKKPHHTSSSSSSFSSSSSSSFPSSLSSKERQQQQQQQQQLSDQRKSYYFSRDLSTTTAAPAPAPAPPPGAEHDNAEMKTTRNADGKSSSSKKKRSGARRNRVSNRGVTTTSSSVATAGGCSFRETVESVWSKPDSTTPEEYPISALDTTSSSSSSDQNETFTLPEFASNNMNIPCFAPEKFDTMLSWSSSTYCRGSKLEKKDTKNKPAIAKFQEPADDKGNGIGIGIDTVSQFNLRPIITNHQSSKTTSKKMESLTSLNATAKVEEPTKIRRDCGGPATARKFSSGNYSSQGLKLRTNSPRIVSRRRIQLQGRKSVSKSRSRRSMSESFAVVKSSKDPQRDFRDSMVEMIIENNLCASKDLEDLLACYLSLNSDEYHDLIITVFKQIWFDIIDIHPN